MDEYRKLNHIEKMDLIDRNSDLSEQLYSKFKMENQENSEIGSARSTDFKQMNN